MCDCSKCVPMSYDDDMSHAEFIMLLQELAELDLLEEQAAEERADMEWQERWDSVYEDLGA